MKSNQMICSGAKECNDMCIKYSTDITCEHRRSHNFIRPKYKIDGKKSCVTHRCYVINEIVKCVPYIKLAAEKAETDLLFNTIKDPCEDYPCPIGLVGYSHINENCQVCELQNECVEFTFPEQSIIDD
jgi:hypothetical protein